MKRYYAQKALKTPPAPHRGGGLLPSFRVRPPQLNHRQRDVAQRYLTHHYHPTQNATQAALERLVRLRLRAARGENAGWGPLGGLVHGALHGAKALGDEFFAKPAEYSSELLQGHRSKAERTRHEMQQFSSALGEGLAPQSVLDIAHGHAPSGEHLGMDALTFLPFSRGLRAAGEGIKAASAAEDVGRAGEAARAAKESYAAGKGVAGGAASLAAKRLSRSRRILGESEPRARLFEHFDRNLTPRQAQAHKELFDSSVKTMVRRGQAKTLHEAVGKLAATHAHLAEYTRGSGALYQTHHALADLQEAVRSAKKPDGGFTLHGDLTADKGADGFVAAHGAYEERIPADQFTEQSVFRYAAKHAALLEKDPALRIGGWHNPEDGAVYLDISRVHPSREVDRAAGARGDWENAFPQTGLSAQEADQIKAEIRAQAHGPESSALYQKDFTEPPRSAGEVAMRAQAEAGAPVKGAMETIRTPEGEKAILHLTEKADVTTFPHELGHFLRRFALRGEDEAKLAEWAGVKNGVWDRSAEEKFAQGLEAMIRNGDAPNNLKREFDTLAPAFKEVYPNGRLPEVPADVAQVYKEILGHRDGPQALYYLLRNARVGAKVGEGLPQSPDQKVADAIQRAREQGYGNLDRGPGQPPRLGPNEQTPETGGALGQDVRGALAGRVNTEGMGSHEALGARMDAQSASAARAAQDQMYHEERARRAGIGRSAMEAQPGIEGHYAALAKLKGELPRVDFQGFKQFDQQTFDAMVRHVQTHPELQFYEKIRANGSLLKAVGGKVPTPAEQKLLERAFGKDTTRQIIESIPFWKKAKNLGLEVLNVPRALMASFDLSAPFRQGLVTLVTRPGIGFANFGPMLKAFGSEKVFQGMMEDVYSRETFPLMQKGGLALTNIGHAGADVALEAREEQFMSNLAEHLGDLPGVRSVPGVSHGLRALSNGVRRSDRAYVGFLDLTRANYFDFLIHAAADQGHDLNDEHLIQSIARYVNAATGRGDLGVLKAHATTLNTLLFSPRLLASRLNFLNPVFYLKLHPFARKEALRAAFSLATTVGIVLEMAKLGGASVNLDPRNADFAKIRIGNTRIDIAGGFQQPIRLMAQLSPGFMGGGRIISSTTGRDLVLGHGVGHLSREDIVKRFIEGKFAPVPSFVDDMLKGSDFQGQPISLRKEIQSRMIPLLGQDLADLYHQSGAAATAAGAGLGVFGIGLQTYGPRKTNPHQVILKLDKDSQAAGIGKPPQVVENDVKWKTMLDDAIQNGMSPFEKAQAAAKIYDQRYGGSIESVLHRVKTQGQAEELYLQIRSRMYPALRQWQNQLSRVQEQKKSQEPVQQPKPQGTAAKPPEAPQMQDVSYHVPASEASPIKPVQYAGGPSMALQESAFQQLEALASGTYSPAASLSNLFTTLASQPIQHIAKGPDGQNVAFQVPRYTGKLGKAARGAVALAQSFLGTPYVWGGESPHGFDCSGLAQYVYAKLGISIPRTSEQQFAAGQAVPKGRLRPGDLVFFRGAASEASPGHVGIYIGHGKFIEAPHTGAVVRISSLAGYPGYVGARRYSRDRGHKGRNAA